MGAIVVIPARLGSTRFPGKMLAADTGRPLVQHVVDQVRKCTRVSDVIVATDDQTIVNALKPFETTCVMTSPSHQSGTDRIAEVMRPRTEAIVVNVQGDEPEIAPEIVDGLIADLENEPQFDMATAATRFPADADVADPNLVKVITGLDGRAIYFSRSVIPHHRDSDRRPAYHLHLGIYAYRRPFLLEYASWPQTPLEMAEKLEQLRVLEHGKSIKIRVVDRRAHGIDTPEQYAAFVRRFKERVIGH